MQPGKLKEFFGFFQGNLFQPTIALFVIFVRYISLNNVFLFRYRMHSSLSILLSASNQSDRHLIGRNDKIYIYIHTYIHMYQMHSFIIAGNFMSPFQGTGNANELSIWKQLIGLKVSGRNVMNLRRKWIQSIYIYVCVCVCVFVEAINVDEIMFSQW
jgi:hypothetical protein